METQRENTNTGPDWKTVEEAAPALKLSVQGLYTAVREKQLPPEAVLKIGRRVRINLRALQPQRGVK